MLALAAALGGAGAAPSQAAVSASAVVSGSGFGVTDFSVALNPLGERSAVALAGERGTRIQLLTRLGRGRSLQPGRRLEDLRARNGNGGFTRISDPTTAVAADGAAIAAWIVTTVARRDGQPSYRLRISTAASGHRFGRPRTLTSSSSSQLALTGVAAGRNGLAVLSWLRGNRVEVAVRRGARFGARQAIGSSRHFDGPPQLALSPGGVAVLAWSPTDGSAAMAAVLPATARRFGAARAVSAPGERTAYARAVAGPGGAGVAWTVAAPAPDPTAGHLRFARMRTGAGGFAAPVTMVGVDGDGAPHVALPRLGVATAWRHFTTHTEPGDTDSITASRLAAAFSWFDGAAPRRLSEPPTLALRPVLAALGDRALIAWREAPELDIGTPVRLAVAAADGWQPTVTLALDEPVQGPPSRNFAIDEGERRAANDLAIAAGGRGALLAWVTHTSAADGHATGRLRIAAYAP